MTEFNKYLKEARQEFCKKVNKHTTSDNLQLRTACDSFLIAFDQATEKAINYNRCCTGLNSSFQKNDTVSVDGEFLAKIIEVYKYVVKIEMSDGTTGKVSKEDLIIVKKAINYNRCCTKLKDKTGYNNIDDFDSGWIEYVNGNKKIL